MAPLSILISVVKLINKVAQKYLVIIINTNLLHPFIQCPSDQFRRVGLVYKAPRTVDCHMMRTGMAVNMSHTYLKRAYEKKLFPVDVLYGSAAVNRAKAIKIFMYMLGAA